MNKTILTVFAGVCSLVLFSCDAPKDYRPSTKTSVDMVAPGTRNTHNIGTTENHGHAPAHGEVVPNHDPGQNKMGGSNEELIESATTNEADSVENHE